MSFNPDQERDERGRWSSGGGGGSGDSGRVPRHVDNFSTGGYYKATAGLRAAASGKPRTVARAGVKKLSSGHSEATQKTVEQARKYFAKERTFGPKGVGYRNAAGKKLNDPFKRRYGKPGTLGEFINPRNVTSSGGSYHVTGINPRKK